MNGKVSILIPCYNEAAHIGKMLDCILAQDYPRELTEVFVIDGMSTDRTAEISLGYAREHSFIKVIENPGRYVPSGLNKGISLATGEYIIRMDAHSGYPENYVSSLVRAMEQTGGDNVGGSWDTRPANDSLMASAIAAATSSGFGVGNSTYRLGVSGIRKVDTVPYGCFRRSLFERIGRFDEDLLRNQDDEFNGRIIKNGGSIYLIPEVSITYYARPDVSSLLRMFYQYAFFKPLVNRKLGKPATLRQFAPPLFIVFLLFGWVGFLVRPWAGAAYVAVLLLYLAIDLTVSARASFSGRRAGMLFILPWLFPLIHGAYGIGYIAGFFHFIVFGKPAHQIRSSR
jgi:glycosyltransferase involved in cell wall biosynthesis